MDPGKIFQIITNSTLLASRLLSGGGGPVQFSEPRYCLVLAEDAPPGLRVTQVFASHKDGVAVRYSITGGNRDGLFTIDQRSGLITLAAPLDYELQPKHELVVAAEAAGRTVHSIVQVTVADVNDNAPHFIENDIQVAVVEEDDRHLPATIFKVEAEDPDTVDSSGLVYSVGGDGVDGHAPAHAYFTINPHTGHLLQLRALDRDPPMGRDTWRVKVQVRDGQRVSPSLAAVSRASRRPRVTHAQHSYPSDDSRGTQDPNSVSQDLKVSPEGEHFRIQESDVPALNQDLVFQDPKMSGQGHYLSPKDSRRRHNQYFLSQEPVVRHDDLFLENRDYGNHDRNERLQAQQENTGKEIQTTQVKAEGVVMYPKSERMDVNKRKNNRSEKPARKSLVTEKYIKRKEEWVEKTQRTGQRERKFQGDIDRKTDGRLLTHTPITDEETSGRETPKKSVQTSYGTPVGDRKVHQTFTRGRIEGGDWTGPTSLPADQHCDQNGNTVNIPGRPRPLRLKYLMRRKHQLTSGLQHRHLSVRGVLKLRAPRRGVGGRVYVRRTKLPPSFTTEPNNYNNETFPFKPKSLKLRVSPQRAPRTRHNRLSPAEDSPEKHRALSIVEQRPSKSTAVGETDLNSPEESDSEDERREDPDDDTPPVRKREAGQLLPENPRYVKRFGTEGGGCEDYGSSFSSSSREEEPSYLREMRREQVHVAETVVTVVVKDINDNAPVFPNTTIYGEVQENGPIDLSVGVVSAWDADDQLEGTNAHLTYSIEKNVIEERSGQAIFTINPETGLVRTAICCLDRETTPEYHIQVVAVDGGGLKGTGTVVVRLADVNDNSPRLTRDLWRVEVDETWGDGAPTNHTLLQVSTADHDTSNYFFYRVVEDSGLGWEHFGMRTEGAVGHLFARETLDYEDPAQRQGFRFMVQVTDRGRGGWSDARHTDTAWVEVKLRDVNDNPPQFTRSHAHVTVREDTAPGTLLASLPAVDDDMMKQQRVDYRVLGGWGALTVDGVGGVRLWRALDREGGGGEVGVARVVAVDEGLPSLSSTATLTITLDDVNDCPPRLLPPTLLHVTEGAPASLLGLLTATDDDVWALGHGPPFIFSLAPSNPAHVLNTLNINYLPSLDSGRGGAEVWTVDPLDREEHRQLAAEVVVTDAGGLAATHPITIIVDDVNDNPMRPGFKTVHLWKTQAGGADAALGRVYVEDPDDWDLEDKTFAWAGPPHPLFTLQPDTGEIFASKQLREGRYELHFSVSDRVWGQTDVPANVTVEVRYLSPEALTHAVPVTLTPTTPAALTSGWTPMEGGGGLGTLMEAVLKVVGSGAESVEVVSVYGLHTFPQPAAAAPDSTIPTTTTHELPSPAPFACVWISVRQKSRSFMDPVKLHGMLALHLQHLEKLMKLRVALEDTRAMEEENGKSSTGSSISFASDSQDPHNPSSVASLASMALPLQVVDTNSTSLVTPRLTRAQECHAHKRHEDETCTATSCLNDGRCIRTDIGDRCVCPGGSWGPQCKVLARTFSGSGWAWVRPLPPCLPTTLSLRLLTRNHDALILYSGPLSSSSTRPHYPPTPMMALQLVGGQPQVVLEGARGPVKLQVNTTLNTGTWHTLHLHLNAQGMTLMVDLCGHEWAPGMTNDAHCIARAPWINTQVTESWSSSVPLQLGGVAHPYPLSAEFGWSTDIVQEALSGCISHLTVNGELVDLGEPAYSSGSERGCRPQDFACRDRLVTCGLRAQCVGGLDNPRCDCQPGWMGPECASPTVPAALGQASYTKIALSFTPDPYDVTLQLRARARGHPDGLLIQLADSQQSQVLKLWLHGGVPCASVSGMDSALQEVCLESIPLGDGSWHTIRVGRHGHNLIISVDDGDGWRRNETLASLLTTTRLADMQPLVAVPPLPITVDKQEGVTVGGIPEVMELSPMKVHDDLQDVCIDDVRVSGHRLPLAPFANETIWGQVTTLQNLEQGCPAPDFCSNITCLPPLSCQDSWRHATCSCEPGQQLLGHRCQDVDECVFQPCLHGGTCYNLTPGYRCVCGPAHAGDNCEWAKLPPDPHPLAAPLAIATLTLSVLVIVVIGILLNIRLHRSRAARGMAVRTGGVEGVTSVVETPVEVQAVTDNPQSRATKEENVLLDSIKIKLPNKQILLSPKGTKHLVTPIGPLTVGDTVMAGSTVKLSCCEDIRCKENTNPPKCSIAAVTTTVADVVLEHRVDISQVVCSQTCTTAVCPVPCPTRKTPAGVLQVITSTGMSSVQPLLAQDDLRAYAYEGDGSPSGSLASTILGLQTESLEEDCPKPLVPEYGEVLDLLKNLPDAVNSKALSQDSPGAVSVHKTASVSQSPKPRQTGVNIT